MEEDGHGYTNLEFWRGQVDTRLANVEHLCQNMNANIEVIKTALQAEKLEYTKFTTKVLIIAGITMGVTSFLVYALTPHLINLLFRAQGGLPQP